jgi:hypothetical protein
MQFSVKCSTQRFGLAIATSLLSGCGMGASDRSAVCPPIAGYGVEVQERAAAEVQALPEGSAVATLLSNYAVMRDQARSCAKLIALPDGEAKPAVSATNDQASQCVSRCLCRVVASRT